MSVPTASPLEITVLCIAARWRVVARGELDLSSGRNLVDVSGVLADARAGGVDLDLSEVTFIDSAGWRAVDAARERVECVGGTFTLTAQSPEVSRFRRRFAAILSDLAA